MNEYRKGMEQSPVPATRGSVYQQAVGRIRQYALENIEKYKPDEHDREAIRTAPDSTRFGDLGVDSMALMDALIGLEGDFDLDFVNEYAVGTDWTIGQIAAYVAEKAEQKNEK